MSKPDFWNLYAQSRGVPAGWAWNILEALGDPGDRPNGAFKIVGAICTATFKTGPRKGKRNWSKRTDERTFFVSTKDFDAFITAWEVETGLCSKCDDGQEWTGSNTPTRPCRKCSGTGRSAPATTATAEGDRA